jgi:tetratricopeptide (TPR) repeat protein
VLRGFLKDSPNSVPATLGLATALTYLGRREEALDTLNKATQWAKGSEREALVRRVRVLTRLFLTNKIFQFYQDGLNFILTKKYRSARERFELALAEEPENVEILIRLGQSLILDGDFKGGIDPLALAKKLNPFEPEVSLWLGRAYLKQGSLAEAVSELRIANEGIKGSEQAPLWLAESLFASGQLVSAIRILERDAKAFPFHLLSLVSAAKYRLQGSHLDYSTLWNIRKSLQSALSRLNKYPTASEEAGQGDSTLGVNRSPSELKSEIQRLLQQVDGRLSEASSKK